MQAALWMLMPLVGLSGGLDAKAVTAEKWINQLTLRFDGDVRYVILFFDTKQTRGLRETVERLNKLSRRSDVVVVGVTPEREQRVRKFLREHRVRFAIGVQSLSYKAFGVKRFPHVVYIEGNDSKSIDDWAWLDARLGEPPEGSDDLPPEELDVEDLKQRIDAEDRMDLLETLRIRTEPAEFLRYCEALAAKRDDEGIPWWRGNLEYQRHLADDTFEIKQSDSTLARDAWMESRRLGTRKWTELREMYASRDSWSSAEVLDFYNQHLGDNPEDIVYRADWIMEIARSGNPSHVNALLDMLEIEGDAAMRSRITIAIGEIHTTTPLPNPEIAIRRLQDDLEREENILWGRPGLQLAIDLLQLNPEEFEE